LIENWRSELALTLKGNETLGIHNLEALDRRAVSKNKASKIHELKTF
jgi:hypothetical protein